MLSSLLRAPLLFGWFAGVVLIVAASAAMGATFSTSVLLLVLGIGPAVVMAFIGLGAPPPTVAEILHAVNTKDGRS